MKITKSTLATIISQMRVKKMTHEDLADHIGMSKPWVTQMLNGKYQRLKESQVAAIEKSLGVKLGFRIVSENDHSQFADEYAARMDNSPALTKMSEAILDLIMERDDIILTPPYVPTEKMAELGKKIREIVENAGVNDKGQPKDGKIARRVLELMAGE